MELTRRDALAALAAGGAALGTGCTADPPTAASGDGAAAPDLSAAMAAAAEVVYPSAVDGVEAFVETYVLGRLDDRDDYRAELEATVAALDATAADWYGDRFASIDPAERDRLLRDLAVHTADPAPEGPLPGRIRYYVVNDLLFALYSSPAGGRLVGIENPVGHPGGIESYRRASTPEDDG